MNKLLVLSLIIIVFVIGSIVTYLFVLPSFVKKPVIEKPLLSSNATLSTDHVSYVANELSTYKLSKSLTGEDPEVEIIVYDRNFGLTQTFSVVVQNNVPSAKFGNAKNPDIRINTTREAFVSLLAAGDFNKEVVDLYKRGEIQVELLKDELTLVTKGYKAIYDQLQQ